MYRAFFTFLTVCGAATVGLAADGSSVKFPSPDGRFALRVTEAKTEEGGNLRIELIEKTSGKIMANLGTAYSSHLSDTVLVWSADSKRVAYATRGNRQGDTSVYFWDGSAFEEASLPETLPSPDIKMGKAASEAGVKNYGGGVKPVRWLKSGELELSSDLMELSRGDGRSYTGVVLFTLAFDAQHHASVHKVGKSKTRVDE